MQTADSQLLTNILILSLLTLPLKGWALWRSARNEQKPWFIAFLVINTLGIMELTYLFYFSGQKKSKHKKEAPEK